MATPKWKLGKHLLLASSSYIRTLECEDKMEHKGLQEEVAGALDCELEI